MAASVKSASTLPERPARHMWRIEEYMGDGGTPRYAVYRGTSRQVWGLRNEASAARWILRLGGVVPLLRSKTESRPRPADEPAALEAAGMAYGDRTPWWSA